MKLIKFNPFRAWYCIALIMVHVGLVQSAFAQQKLPLIRATSKNVSIKDGYILQIGTWNLSPEVKLDSYHAIKPFTRRTITFYTDQDSIAFDVVSGQSYNFDILLNGKDTCHTQITMDKMASDTLTGNLKPINPELLAMDFLIFRNYLQAEHAGLYRYKTKEQMEKLFDEGLLSIKEPMSKLEFGKKIMYLISQIQDGHTGTNLSSLIFNTYKDEAKLFPLFLYFDEKQAFVRCAKPDGLPIGTEILSIDGIPIKSIKQKLFAYLPSDGQIQTKKRHTLNNGSFAFLYNLVFGNKNSFLISYKNLKGSIKTVHIKATFAKDFDCELNNQNVAAKDLQLKYLQKDIALLTIRSFDQGRLNRAKLNFKTFLANAFKELETQKTEKLIIDLRGNAGGLDEYGPLLYSYLTQQPFKYLASVYEAGNQNPLTNNPLLKIQQAQATGFTGKVAFLIDGLSFSTTADFCAIAKSNHRGLFVGEETAGAYYGNNSGQTIKIELPNSKIQIIIPKFRYTNAVKKTKYKDRGTLPDYPIIPGINDLIKNRDVQLERAIALLEK